MREQVLGTPVLYEVELLIRGRHAKTAAEDHARRQNRTTRQAKVEVRAATVTLRPPARSDRQLPPVTVSVVLVREPNPPPGAPPVEWILLTTLPIDAPEQVRLIVAYYSVRWDIEIYFRFFKHVLGCQHLLSATPDGIAIQAYGAWIAWMLISLWTGRQPTRRT